MMLFRGTCDIYYLHNNPFLPFKSKQPQKLTKIFKELPHVRGSYHVPRAPSVL